MKTELVIWSAVSIEIAFIGMMVWGLLYDIRKELRYIRKQMEVEQDD